MGSGHFNHCHNKTLNDEIKKYWLVALATLISLVFEIGGGITSKSLALLSDGLHVTFDFGSVILVIFIEYYLCKDPNNEKKKLKIRSLGGVIISIFLFISAIIIFQTAIKRLITPNSINSGEMIICAIIGLVGNGASLWFLRDNKKHHITRKALTAHIVSDLIQSVGVVFVGFMILLTNWQVLDPICSFLIAILIFRISIRTLTQSLKSNHMR